MKTLVRLRHFCYCYQPSKFIRILISIDNILCQKNCIKAKVIDSSSYTISVIALKSTKTAVKKIINNIMSRTATLVLIALAACLAGKTFFV